MCSNQGRKKEEDQRCRRVHYGFFVFFVFFVAGGEVESQLIDRSRVRGSQSVITYLGNESGDIYIAVLGLAYYEDAGALLNGLVA